MVGGRLSGCRRWFDDRSAGAPPALRERAARYLEAGSEPELPDRLAAAAAAALAVVLGHPKGGDRSAALDLLAADALVTLALLAKAGADPGGLAAFAARLRESHGDRNG